MAEHTPGPWVVRHRVDCPCVEVGLTEQTIVLHHFPDWTDEDAANMALIAAAPDLLAACEAALKPVAWLARTDDQAVEVLDQLVEALTRAKGGRSNG